LLLASAEQVFKSNDDVSLKIIRETFCTQDPHKFRAKSSTITELTKLTPEVLITVIDTYGRTKEEFKDIRLEVIKLGHKIGAMIHCTKKSSLDGTDPEESFKMPEVENFPHHILRKLNVMQGGRNFDFAPSPFNGVCHAKPIMVVGAHVTHPRSHVSNYSRSVASVVASTEPDLMHYPGSVRCQDTLRMPLRHEDAEKRYFRSTIIDLEGMMVERFKAWKAAAGDHSPGGSDQSVREDCVARNYRHP
jgi:hypothetical protein